MLKKFFFNVLSSFMGAWLAIVMSGLCIALVVLGILGILFGKHVKIEDGTVLKIELKGGLIERDDPSQLDFYSLIAGRGVQYQTLENLTAAIKEAKDNDKIKAIYLDCGMLSSAPASINALRDALIDFRKSGKPVFAYADQYSQSSYYVATAANELYVNPQGSVDLHGLGGETLFYKGLFDKIGVEFQVVRVGEGKSAVEPYTQTSMSDYARNQTMQLIDTIWDGLRGTIAQSRGLSSAGIDSLINNYIPSIRTGVFALQHKLVDGTMYRHEFEDHIAKKVGQKDGLKLVVSAPDLASISSYYKKQGGDKQIAVVYACGGIDTEMGGGINSAQLVNQIIELGRDEKVKGLVLRVNSPGGSAYGSEQIWEALEWFKKQNKPVAVSMGDYAASGGYYISAAGNRIFADRFTITGSIGIFGLIPNIHGLLEMIGINPQMVATNPQAQLFTLTSPLDEHQLASMQQMVNEGYNLFVTRCAEGRNLPVDSIKSIADGRPIPATVALRYNLIDEIGSLKQAIEWTAKRAGISKDYHIGVYPELKTNLLVEIVKNGNGQLPASVENMLLQNNWTQEMLNRLSYILNADRMRTEYPLLKLSM